jgi:hypothetical protein
VFACALAWGAIAAWHYHSVGLTLSHYDAKGHLVVARRIFDSITPGWKQIGAVWLPLPHLLNVLPVQVDAFYRTGASGVALSVLAFALTCRAAAHIVLRATGSASAALLAAGLLALNPNLLYLQATPMTEPLLLAGLMLSALALQRWIEAPALGQGALAGVFLACACLTRYEAWPFTAAALTLTAIARWRRHGGFARSLVATAAIAVFPALAIAGFLVLGKLTTNHWFVTDGFYVVDPALARRPAAVTAAIWFGLRRLGSAPLAWTAALAAAVVAWRGLRDRRHASALVTLALAAVAALPWYAFYEGHPFRIRYMVPLVAGAAVGVGIGVGWLPRSIRRAAALLLLVALPVLLPPLGSGAAMVAEAKWDQPKSAARRHVTACLAAERQPGEPILASMGSLAHYMQELSAIGLDIEDFIHEGNGSYWVDGLSAPGLHVPWVLAEERSEGGDAVARRAARDPEYLAWFARRCEGGGVALYENTVMRRGVLPRSAPAGDPSR